MSDTYLAPERFGVFCVCFLFVFCFFLSSLKAKCGQVLNTRRKCVDTNFPHFTEFNTVP